jgi:F-type H+-transporting ATPase subunit gamma
MLPLYNLLVVQYANFVQNASKNAGDMIGKYQILFNRTRQAVITGELVEIITGAAASEE